MTRIFHAGGALSITHSSYVRRLADRDAQGFAEACEYLYIIAPRQMGKTSLLKRLAFELSEKKWRCSYVDLSALKGKKERDWYDGLGRLLSPSLTPGHRPSLAEPIDLRFYLLSDVLPQSSSLPRVALLFDEVEAMTEHPFSDGFFMTLRSLYNERDDYSGDLVVAFAGTVNPLQLVKDDTISPFNVSKGIKLDDFDLAQAFDLTSRLSGLGLPMNDDVHNHIYEWTSGHPYLTQQLCASLESWANEKRITSITPDIVDCIVETVFLDPLTLDSNITHIYHELAHLSKATMDIWHRVVGGDLVSISDEGVYELWLAGVVKPDASGNIVIRNRVYRHMLLQEKTKTVITQGEPEPPAFVKRGVGHRIVRILHISDIHRASEAPTSNTTLLGKLQDDIFCTYEEDNKRLDSNEPQLGRPDLIVVSGDLTQCADEAEFKIALGFLEGLLPLVDNKRQRVILVPGNHDVSWTIAAQSYLSATAAEYQSQPPGGEPYRQSVKRAPDGTYWRKDNATYTNRFRPFKEFFDSFYQGLYLYPLARDSMFTVYDLRDPYGLVFVGFNSCDEIDACLSGGKLLCLDRRAFINTDAIYKSRANAIFESKQTNLYVAVFHHNVYSVDNREDFLDRKYLQILKRHGFDLCLHGHVHIASHDIFDPMKATILPVVGSGSLAASYLDRPPAAPRGYNLVVIDRESNGIWVHTRRHDENNLVWAADYQWDGKPYFVVRPQVVSTAGGQQVMQAQPSGD